MQNRSQVILSPCSTTRVVFNKTVYSNIKDTVVRNPQLNSDEDIIPLNIRAYSTANMMSTVRYYIKDQYRYNRERYSDSYRISIVAKSVFPVILYSAIAAAMVQNPMYAAEIISAGRDYTYVNRIGDRLFGKFKGVGYDFYGRVIRYISRIEQGEKFPQTVFENKMQVSIFNEHILKDWKRTGREAAEEDVKKLEFLNVAVMKINDFYTHTPISLFTNNNICEVAL